MSLRSIVAVFVASFLATCVNSMAITSPDATTIFFQSSNNTVAWSTDPPSANMAGTQFDLWLRNYKPQLATPVNISIALNLTVTAAPFSWIFTGAASLPIGTGYQLFATQPGDASIVYADTPVFAVAAGVAPTTASLSTAAPSTTADAVPTSSSVTSSTTSSSSTSTTPASTNNAKIPAATNPGGPLEQGFQYEHLFSSSSNTLSLAQGATTVALAAAAFAFLMY